MNRIVGLAALVVATVLCANSSAAAWTPPIGIPAPPFGINEVAPPTPNPWTTPTAGFYYVDETAPSATDSANPYGTPSLPRRTIPLSLPAGAVVELHGTYTTSHTSPSIIVANGTASRPVFIRGMNSSSRPQALRRWQLRGTYYIVENIVFAAPSPTYSSPVGVNILAPTDSCILRYNDVSGSLSSGSAAFAAYGVSSTSTVSNCVIYGNRVHDNGDINSPLDQDAHGIGIGGFVSNFWVLENEVTRTSGSGIVINAGSLSNQSFTHHIYVGRNRVYRTRQSGIHTKQAVDVIFSQNLAHDIINTSWSPAKAAGFQYAPDYVWFLYNYLANATYGIYAGSDSGLGTGTESFMIGNVIYNIHYDPTLQTFNPGTAWSNAGIMLAGGVNRHVVNNTIYDVDGGINSPGSSGGLYMSNNIVSSITQSGGKHVFIEQGTTASASILRNSLFDGSVRIRWGSTTVYDLPGLQSGKRQGLNSINADPRFVNPAAADFQLQSGSAAIDGGGNEDVYKVFRERYGIDIARDVNGVPRPQGASWDIGAFEFGAGGPPPPAPTGLQVR